MNNFMIKLVGYSYQKIFIFSVVLAAIYYFTMYDDGTQQASHLEKIKVESAAEKDRRKITESALKEEGTVKARVVQLSEQYEILSKKMPSNITSADLNKYLNEYIKTSGAKLKTFQPENITSKEVYDEVPVNITVEGSFSEVAYFVYLISSSERTTSIRDFVVAPSREGNKVTLSGIVVGYKLAQAEKAVDGKPAVQGQPNSATPGGG